MGEIQFEGSERERFISSDFKKKDGLIILAIYEDYYV